MEKEVKTTMWIEDGAVRVEASFEDFDGDVAKWKDAFYQIWRCQLTWDFAYSIGLIERRHEIGGEWFVWLRMLVKSAYIKNVEGMLEELGYRNVTVNSEHVGIVQLYDIEVPEEEDMYEVFAE